ncbi:hypothetical protein [Aquisalimonas sp.]|uniref:hypothetical protein n=1 Tax=Aquisalimonas sp. TaxID=1872621 RepID=UPI0025BE29E3|nr:hypothetical protein [Aquisalimonas sp.]
MRLAGFDKVILSALQAYPIGVLEDLRANFNEERIRHRIAPQAPALLHSRVLLLDRDQRLRCGIG